eukprot:TRINITY_DN1085_c0_g1_i2.p1 TRINITY_DN1085_c0_g1~~TRINITY_DN1085_c0_g1_i2.p1  ORF type:complete len:360 (+),score=52.60 TRINITY_DN1085_c0_g1_i2:136-1215(+)
MMGDESLALGVDRLKFDELKTERMVKEGAVLQELREKLSFRQPTPPTEFGEPQKVDSRRSSSSSGPPQTPKAKGSPSNSAKVTPNNSARVSPSNSFLRIESASVNAQILRSRDGGEQLTPRSGRASGCNTPTSGQTSSVAAKYAAAAAANNGVKQAASTAASQVKNLASSFTTDTAAKLEKQRKLDQLRGGSFKTSGNSKKWSPPAAAKIKTTSDLSSDTKPSEEGAENDSVLQRRKNWEVLRNATFENKQVTYKKDSVEQQGEGEEKGFGDLMKRFKVIEGSEKSEQQKNKENRQGISSKAAMFETSVKKTSSKALLGQSTSKKSLGGSLKTAENTGAENAAPRSNSIRERAAMFQRM